MRRLPGPGIGERRDGELTEANATQRSGLQRHGVVLGTAGQEDEEQAKTPPVRAPAAAAPRDAHTIHEILGRRALLPLLISVPCRVLRRHLAIRGSSAILPSFPHTKSCEVHLVQKGLLVP